MTSRKFGFFVVDANPLFLVICGCSVSLIYHGQKYVSEE
jgi:hypothetical protein